MKTANQIFRVITVIGLITVVTVIVDYVLPAEKVETIVTGKRMGIEGGRKKRHTHQLILSNESMPFPVSIVDRQQFNEGDTILVETSCLLDNQIRLTNSKTGFQTIPVLGLYSYFSVVVGLLLLSVLFGLLYWNYPMKHMNSIPFTVFLIGFVLFLIYFY
ncbi:MAG: hypothetical protein CMB80_18405 [Flammeovirgaceae bacterium]|nr:hypothetical protein [Flammeovirgaceae bacterium]MBR08544.1 hypothetical protein [Rickettsiales bacterium]MBR08873.1 hypothetical protein [Rickettsiales bacterium]HCX22988.1 hypothetical protein [Cytophagales bacterium]|tara:strand:+ start:344 stop:823 length:480 start_codon:yes stop_codon:yes gene_type:complete